MNVRKNFFFIVTLLIITATTFLQSQLLEDKRQHSLLLRGIDLTLQQQYDSAETVFKSIIAEFPRHPAGYLYLAGLLQARNTDYGDWFNAKRYDSLLTIVENLSLPLINNKGTEAFGHYYTGSAEAFRSYTKSENGNLPSGIYYGMSAGASLVRCVAIDSNFTEAKNILGSFYFWRSKMAWIPFISDRSEEGIRLITESFSHPYEKHLASHNLMVIFTEQKRYADAEKYGRIMLKEYPDNRLFLWNMMTVYEQWNKKKELQDVVVRLLSSTMKGQVINRYAEAVCRLKLARFALDENNPGTAKKELNMVIALRPFIGNVKGNLKKKISDAEDLLETIEHQ